MRFNKNQCKYCKIVLTGGPGAGKSTAIQLLQKCLTEEYKEKWRVYTVGEACGFLFQGRIDRSTMNKEQINKWQESLVQTIIQLEGVYDNIIELEKNYNILIICDRGCLDPKVFTENKQWNKILNTINETEETLLKRYDCIIQQFYTKTNNSDRRETFTEAKAINHLYESVWKCHQNFYYVDNGILSDEMIAEEAWNKKYKKIYKIIKNIIEK